MSGKIDLFTSSKEEFKKDVIDRVKEDISEFNGEEFLNVFLEYLFEKAYLKGGVDQRQLTDKMRGEGNI